MINIGDIVYKKRRGGFLHSERSIIKESVGLVIKEIKDRGSIPQYYVQFDQNNPQWYYQHDLHRIGGKGN